jgi:ABC-type polysaccharide/polyol phosphate export permease
MDYLSMFYLWSALSTFFAGVTYAISMFAGKKYTIDTCTEHWVNWILFPVWLIILITASCFVSIVEDTIKTKIRVIKKMWLVFVKNLLGNW